MDTEVFILFQCPRACTFRQAWISLAQEAEHMPKYGFPLLFGDPFLGLLFRWAATTLHLVALDGVSLAVDLTAPSLVAPGQDENKEKTPPEDFQVLTV